MTLIANKTNTFFFLSVFMLISTVGISQQLKETQTRTAAEYRTAASKTTCPDLAKYLNLMASYTDCLTEQLAKGSKIACNLPPGEVPLCAGDGIRLGSSVGYSNRGTNNGSTENTGDNTTALVGSATAFNFINPVKRSKWNKDILRRADEFQNTYGITVDAVEEAIDISDTAALQTMIAKGIDLNIDIINAHETLLYYATDKNKTDMVKILLKSKADINKACPKAPDKYGGLTSLHSAAFNGNLELVKLLVDHGAALDPEVEFWRTTPIFLAIQRNRLNVVKYLKEKGANLSHTRKWENAGGFYLNLTPLEYARKMKNDRVVGILLGD